jgi:hypothetical protein
VRKRRKRRKKRNGLNEGTSSYVGLESRFGEEDGLAEHLCFRVDLDRVRDPVARQEEEHLTNNNQLKNEP